MVAGVKRLSVSELNELLEEIEAAIKEFSEELVQQLALRDELEFEKEVKNSFISVLIEVQNKQKEHKETAKKKKKLKNGGSQNGKNERSHMPGTVSGVQRESPCAGSHSRGGPRAPGRTQADRACVCRRALMGLWSGLETRCSALAGRCFLGEHITVIRVTRPRED